MTNFFPRQTVAWKLEEPPAFRRLTLSVVEMAVLTGVVLRLVRSIALTQGPADSWLYLGGAFALGIIVLFGMATAHLGNYPITHWLWRAPAFAAIEAAAELLVSLPLIAAGREPMGSGRATFADWPAMALETVITRVVMMIVFAAVLASVVQLVRRLLLRHDHREHTAIAVHDEIVRSAEQGARH